MILDQNDSRVATADRASPQEGSPRDLTVVRPFTLTKQDGEQVTYGVGTHKNVPHEVHSHWYAQAHSLKDGESLPEPVTGTSSSDREIAARKNAEDECERLRTLCQKATDDRAAGQVEIAQLREQLSVVEAERNGLREQLSVVEAERDGLREQLESRDVSDASDEEDGADELRVTRRGRKWLVERRIEDGRYDQIGEFPNKDAADAKLLELRGDRN